MQIGELNRQITLQQSTRVSDGMGSFTLTWADVDTVWAKAWTVSSTEMQSDMKVNLVRIQKFAIRYRSTLDASWRIKWGTRYFNITGIDVDGKNEFVYLTVKEIE